MRKRLEENRVDELKDYVTSVVHLDCNLGEHVYLYNFEIEYL